MIPRTQPPWVERFDIVDTVRDGDLVAIGGVGGSRKPMALVRALADAGIRDLRIVSVLGGIDVDYLLASGCVAEVHTAGVAIDGVGMAPRYRQARQNAEVAVIEWSEGSLHAALEAAARGLPSLPCTMSPDSDVVTVNESLRAVADPFAATPVVYARALAPDVALLHVPTASAAGDLFIDGDPGFDAVIACASSTVVASVEDVCERPGHEAALSRIWVDVVVHSPGGAWPTACYPFSAADGAALGAWVKSHGDPAALGERP
ncbi:MAG: CoA transferase subunit A [Nostocoides sp.]